MPKYLIEASFTAEGAKGLIKGGGTARRAEVQKMVESLGGRVEAFYFVFGENDVHVILDLPENLTAAAISSRLASTKEKHALQEQFSSIAVLQIRTRC